MKTWTTNTENKIRENPNKSFLDLYKKEINESRLFVSNIFTQVKTEIYKKGKTVYKEVPSSK